MSTQEEKVEHLQTVSPVTMYHALIKTMQPEHQKMIYDAVAQMDHIVNELNKGTDQNVLGTLAGGLFCVQFNTTPLLAG